MLKIKHLKKAQPETDSMKSNMNQDILIVRGKWIIPGGEQAQDYIENAALVIEGNHIKEIDSWDAIQKKYPSSQVIGSNKYAIIPGLINGHHHNSGVSSIQQNIPDNFLDAWLLSLTRSRETDPYLVTSLAAARQLRAGVTSVVDISPLSGTLEACSDQIAKSLKAYEKIGMRSLFTIQGPREMNHIVFGDNEKFFLTLPGRLRERTKEVFLSADGITWDECIDLFKEFYKQYEDHACINVSLAPEGPTWVSDKTLAKVSDIAKTYHICTQTHVLESVYEKDYAQEHFKKSMVSYMKNVGFLGQHVSFAHSVWVSKDEMKLMAESGTSIVHNPGSNLRLRNGIAPLKDMLEEGVNLVIGMDGLSFNDDDDIWTELRLALRLSNLPYGDSKALCPEDIFKMATHNGAKLLGLEHKIGELKAGRKADLVLIDLEQIAWPWIAPETNPLQLLISRATSKDVDTVIVDGKIVVEKGQLKTIDEKALAIELAECLSKCPFPSDQASIIEALIPHMAKFYETKYPR